MAALRRGRERWEPGGRDASGITLKLASLVLGDQVAGKVLIDKRGAERVRRGRERMVARCWDWNPHWGSVANLPSFKTP